MPAQAHERINPAADPEEIQPETRDPEQRRSSKVTCGSAAAVAQRVKSFRSPTTKEESLTGQRVPVNRREGPCLPKWSESWSGDQMLTAEAVRFDRSL